MDADQNAAGDGPGGRRSTSDSSLEKRRQQNRKSQQNYRRRVQSRLQILENILNDRGNADGLSQLLPQAGREGAMNNTQFAQMNPAQSAQASSTPTVNQMQSLPNLADLDWASTYTQQLDTLPAMSTALPEPLTWSSALPENLLTMRFNEVPTVPNSPVAPANLHDGSVDGTSQDLASEGEDDAALRKNSDSSIEARGSILHDAVLRGHFDIARILLLNGADPRVADNMGRSALHAAASSDNVAMVQLLLLHGAPVDSKDHEGNTALRLAVILGSAKMVQVLVAAGASSS